MKQNAGMIGNIVKLQTKVAAIQKEISDATFTGDAGGGLVKLEVKGTREILSANMNPEVLKEDTETVCDLFVAAFNDANRKIETSLQTKMGEVTKGLGLAGLKIPGING